MISTIHKIFTLEKGNILRSQLTEKENFICIEMYQSKPPQPQKEVVQNPFFFAFSILTSFKKRLLGNNVWNFFIQSFFFFLPKKQCTKVLRQDNVYFLKPFLQLPLCGKVFFACILIFFVHLSVTKGKKYSSSYHYYLIPCTFLGVSIFERIS